MTGSVFRLPSVNLISEEIKHPTAQSWMLISFCVNAVKTTNSTIKNKTGYEAHRNLMKLHTLFVYFYGVL